MTFRIIRVFISSTFRDMGAERDHLVRFVFPRLRETLLARRIHLVDVDLRWGVTSEQNVETVCRDIIDECRPRFICILGGRYGWIPPGKTESITVDEIRYGVLNRTIGDRGFAYFYFRDDAATQAIRKDRIGEYCEPAGSASEHALRDLKSAVSAAGFAPFIYDACWDDRSSRLIGLESFGGQVYDDLLRSVTKEFGDEVVADAADLFSREIDFIKAFVDRSLTHFVLGNRAPVEKRLLDYARNGTEGYLCLVGEPGSGKSTLLAHLLGQLAQSEFKVIAHFVGAGRNSADVEYTLRRLSRELGFIDEIDPSALSETFEKALRDAAETTRVVLVIDGVNAFDNTPNFFELNWLPRTLPPNGRVILSTTPTGAPAAMRQRGAVFTELPIERLARSDGVAIADQFMHRFGKTMTERQQACLLGKTDANLPLYLLAALEELRTLGAYEEIDRRLSELPPQTLPLFEWIFARLESEDGFRDCSGITIGPVLVKGVIAALAASRGGLSESELGQLLDMATPDRNNSQNLSALLLLLRPFIMWRNELIDFYHDQVREAATARYLISNAEQIAAHALLARLFLAQLRASSDRRRAGEHVVYHLRRAEMWDQLIACLSSDDDLRRLSPSAYGMSFDAAESSYIVADKDSLTPELVATMPVPIRTGLAQALADIFIARAKDKILLTRNYEQPWPVTCRRLRDASPQEFLAYRDTFYLFIRYAGLAYAYAAIAYEDSPASAGSFFDRDGGSGAFLHYLENFGHRETGLSHAVEDEASEAHDHVVRLARIRDAAAASR